MAHPKILNSASKGHSCRPDVVSVERSHLSSGSQVLVHQRLAGLGTMSHFPASSIRSRSVCSTFLLEWDMHDPEVVRPTWSCISGVPFLLRCPGDSPFVLAQFPSTSARSCVTIFLPQSASFDGPLAATPIECETALHAFEHRLSLKPGHLAARGPQSTIRVCHDFP